MKVYIPFNMIVDTDFGVIRLVEKLYKVSELPVDKVKSFLIKRINEDPVQEYCELRKINEVYKNVYEVIMKKFYSSVLKLSKITDILAFVINTHKLGFSNEVEITIGCNTEEELEFFNKFISSLKYTIDTNLNSNIKLNDYDYIFIRCLDEYYVDYLINNKISGKRLYVADYRFNTIVDEEKGDVIINPLSHLQLESNGNIVSLISVYNKK